MSFQYAHHRPLTPITPVHSPHPSNGSIPRTRTPGQLSLHEYRKSQVTPSPPAIHGQRSVKKKRAASSLKNYEGTSTDLASPELFPSFHSLSTPPLTPSLPTPTNFTSHLSLPIASPTRDGPKFAEFSHLTFSPTTRQQRPSFDHAPLLPQHPSASSSHLHLSSTPSSSQALPRVNFLSNLFPFTHAAAKPSRGDYQAIGSEDLEEEQLSVARYVTLEQVKHPRTSLSSQSGEADKKQILPSRLQASSQLSAILPDSTHSRHFVGSQAPRQVSSRATLPGTERRFERVEAFGLAQDSGHAQPQTQ